MKKIILIYVTLLLILTISFTLNGKESDPNAIPQTKLGNFALPPSQQIGPLIAFGENMFDKGQLQIYNYVAYLHGINKNLTLTTPSILYAISDTASIFFELPIIAQYNLNNESSHGFGDAIVQGEYAFFVKNTFTTASMITVVGNITLPFGSPNLTPPTGLGSTSFFLGYTATHQRIDWFLFSSAAAIIPLKHDGTKYGKDFLYQMGVSKNIGYVTDNWLCNWVLEIDGTYKQRDKTNGIINRNTGGNEILLTPSIWFAARHIIIQGGIAAIVSQHLFGSQAKDQLFFAINIGWTFNN